MNKAIIWEQKILAFVYIYLYFFNSSYVVQGKNMTLTAFSKMAKNIELAFGCEENTPIEKIEVWASYISL